MNRLRLALIGIALIFGLPAQAGDRVALVIGMAAYAHVDTLDNTVNDAHLIADTLTGIGFDVTLVTDAGYQDLRAAMDRFAFQSETADLALIYFAGHAVEVQGENYMIPVDANVGSNRDVQRQSVSLDDMLATVDRARVMRIVILDSCRDNPFGDALDLTAAAPQPQGDAATRGAGGLAAPAPDRGTLVAFAARDGQVALDGTGSNSPFALALADKMKIPGLEISLMFRQVRDERLVSRQPQRSPAFGREVSGRAHGVRLRAWAP